MIPKTNKSLIVIIFIFLNILMSSAMSEEIVPDSIKIGERIRLHSHVLNEDRIIQVIAPVGYHESADKYPVIYLLDGDAISRLMKTAATMEELDANGWMPQCIVVGIDSKNAVRDYLPQPIESRPESGQADKFLMFIEQEVIPKIDSLYRCEDYKILIGGSNSGLFALYSLFSKPSLFNAVIAASPSVGWCNEYMIALMKEALANSAYSGRTLYMNSAEYDINRLVSDPLPKFITELEASQTDDLKWSYEFVEGGDHVPYISIYNGLKAVFSEWKFPKDQYDSLTFTDVKEYYDQLSEAYGFRVKLPSALLMDLGQGYYRDSKFDMAGEVYLAYLIDYPNSSRANFFMAEICRAKDECDSAKLYYSKTLELDPDFTPAQRHLSELKCGPQ